MGPSISAGEKRGLTTWLVMNTSLSVEQIASFTGLGPLEVQAIADGHSPRPLPVDPIRAGWVGREAIEAAQSRPQSRLPRPWAWCEASLSPVTSRDTPDAPIEDVFASRVAYMFYGRNAWHSTWIQRYYSKNSIALVIGGVQRTCERNRVQGTVFNIEELPCLVFHTPDRTLYAVEINGGGWLSRCADIFSGPLFVRRILRCFEAIPPNQVIWLGLPERVTAKPPHFGRQFQRMSSYPQGSNRPLGWKPHSGSHAVDPRPWGRLTEAVTSSIPLTNALMRAATWFGEDAASCPSDLDVSFGGNGGFTVLWRGRSMTFDATGEPHPEPVAGDPGNKLDRYPAHQPM